MDFIVFKKLNTTFQHTHVLFVFAYIQKDYLFHARANSTTIKSEVTATKKVRIHQRAKKDIKFAKNINQDIDHKKTWNFQKR